MLLHATSPALSAAPDFWEGWSALHRVCLGPSLGTNATKVRALIRKDRSSLLAATPEGWTAPMLIAQSDPAGSPLFEWLIQEMNPAVWQGAQDLKGWTVLHHAAAAGCSNVMRALLRRPWAIDDADHRGNTALHLAAQEGHTSIVEQLLRMGARPDRLNLAGDSPLTLAAENGHRDCVMAMDDVRLDVPTLLFDAVCTLPGQGDETVITANVQRALDLGADLNAEDEDIPALHHAAHNGHLEVVRLLLDRGAALHRRDDQGNTALHLTITTLTTTTNLSAQLAIATLLLDRGAHPGHTNQHGIPALLIAQAAQKQRPDLPELAALADRCARQAQALDAAELETVLDEVPAPLVTPARGQRARL